MDLARRFIDGFFTAILVYLALSQSKGFAEIIGSTASGGAKLAYTLQGQNSPFNRPT